MARHGLLEHVARLGQRPLGGVDEEQDRVDHQQAALDLAAEVGVARRVHDVEADVAVVDAGLLGQDGDALLALEIAGVHDALGHDLVGAEGAGLPKHGVDERGLAVVDVGDDGDVAEVGACCACGRRGSGHVVVRSCGGRGAAADGGGGREPPLSHSRYHRLPMTTDQPTLGLPMPPTRSPRTRMALTRCRAGAAGPASWPSACSSPRCCSSWAVPSTWTPQPLLPEATTALASTNGCDLHRRGRLAGLHAGRTRPPAGAATGLIFYPGAKVPAAADAPAAQAIAKAGYPAYIAEMPLDLAILDGNAAADIQAAHPEVRTWVIGGHSYGGVMAAGYAADHRDTVEGIALWASYPSLQISGADLVTSSIFGTLDSGMERMTSAETKAKLPAATTFVPIEGGNHEQMV